jgi:hypothetical protein
MFFLFPLFPLPADMAILILVTISIFAVELVLPVSPPIAPFLSDDASCESHREH